MPALHSRRNDMAHKELVVALSMIVAASPVPAASLEPAPTTAAPAGTAGTRYCLRVAPVTGSLIETVQCWTRDEWAEEGVDVDKEWAREGVGVIA
jgi:hypothetical protein